MRPGIVDVRDLANRYAWQPREITRFVAAAGLSLDEGVVRRFTPPRVVVVIAPDLQPDSIQRSHAWLAGAEHVVIVRDRTSGNQLGDDPEVRALHEQEWRDVVAGLRCDVVEWSDDPAVCGEAVRRAIAAHATLAPAAPDEPAPEPRWLALAPSPWIEIATEGAWRMSSLPNQLVIDDARACLRLDPSGTLVDLAAAPPALRLIADGHMPRPGYMPLGGDPSHRVGWRGYRMTFYWYLAGGGFLSASDHDWPCGPAKKLYGYADNDPVQITMTPAADACAARFEHDVMVTAAIPIPWRRAGEVDVATWPRDPDRAVFFAQDPDDPAPRDPDIDPLDEDARDLAPALVLGPSKACRYAVDLHYRVYRITNPTLSTSQEVQIDHVGGPGEGYVVCDAHHAIVRRGTGRLLGGWFRYATVEDAGRYFREDLATGERTAIAPVDLAICDDPEVEAIARDAIREGRHEVAAQIHASYPAQSVEGERGRAPEVYAIPGTVNVLIAGKRYVRVL